jgi:hypothetical protein
MIFTAIFGLMILAVVVYVSLRVVGNVFVGIALIALILIGSFFLLGSIPDLKQVPLIGAFIPDIPGITGDVSATPSAGGVILVFKNIVYNLKVIGVERSSSANLLISVVNAGKLDLHGFRVIVDGTEARIGNAPKSTLASGESTVIEASWSKPYTKLTIWTLETSADYPA